MDQVRIGRRGLLAGMGTAVLVPSPQARAQAPWPAGRATEVIVGFAAGGGVDITARAVAQHMTHELPGANFIVLNRTGAAGETAYAALQMARPDGYTIGWLATPGYVAMGIERQVRYDRAKIRPIARLIDDPAALMVRADSPYRTLKDLVEAAKRRPDSISVGSSGVGTVSHLGLTLLQAQSGASFIHAPFSGAGPAKNALLGGHIDVCGLVVGELGTMGQDREALRVLTVMARKRVELVPEVATAREDGFDLVISGERGIAAPGGIPDEVALRLQGAIQHILGTPAFLERARHLELPLAYLSGADWERRMAEQEAEYRRIWARTPWR